MDAGWRRDAGQTNHVGVDFRRVEIIERSRSDARGDRSIRGVFVRPCSDSASLMDNAENTVGADEFPGENGRAASRRVLRQLFRIDRSYGAVREGSARSSAVYLTLVDVNTFFIFSGKTGRWRPRGAGTGAISVAGHHLRSVEIARVRNVVIDARERGAAAGDDRGQARK